MPLAPACGGLVYLRALRPARWTLCTPVVEAKGASIGPFAGPEIEDGDAPGFERLAQSAELGDGAETEVVGQSSEFARRLRDGLHAVETTEALLSPVDGLKIRMLFEPLLEGRPPVVEPRETCQRQFVRWENTWSQGTRVLQLVVSGSR